MTDSAQVIDALNLLGNAPDAEEQPDAAETAATSTETSDDGEELISLDEALAELDGETAPDQTAAPATTPETTETALPDVAELQRQLDEYKAKEAITESANADAVFTATWQNLQAVNDDFFEAEIARMERIAADKGFSDADLKAAIYERVELGNGFGIEEWNPLTRRMELKGRIQADRELLQNYNEAALTRERAKTQPSQFDRLVTTYALDDTQRVALAKFINYPPEHLEEIARTFGAQNQRATTTQEQARNDAVANVRTRLSQQPAPGNPGESPRQRKVQLDHSRKSTEYVARAIGFVR
jgi:hypothetical protein